MHDFKLVPPKHVTVLQLNVYQSQFLNHFRACMKQGRSYLPAIRNALRSRMRPATSSPSSSGPLKIPQRPDTSRCSEAGRVSEYEGGRGVEVAAAPARRVKPECLNTLRIPPRLQQRNGIEVSTFMFLFVQILLTK